MADEERVKPRILNVADDEVKRNSVTGILERAGYEVVEAGTGEEALRLARKLPDLVILDVNLPDISGFEVVRRLRAAPETAGLPVLHLSGTAGSPGGRVEGPESGADAYLVEPVEEQEVLASVEALLRVVRRTGPGAPEPPVNVLLVDDQPANVKALEALLSDLRLNVVKAGSGSEALRSVLNTDFAVILLDVHMPKMDGFETAAAIRSRDRSRQTPIIFITAHAGDELAGRSYALGAVDYLAKPIDPDVLRAKVAALAGLDLRSRAARRRVEARHSAVLRAALDAIVLTGEDGTVVEWNPAAERTFGYARSEAVGASLAELILPQEVRAAHPAGLRDLLVSAPADVAERRLELTACRRGGEELPVELSVTRVPGEPPLYAGNFRDISRRRRDEERQRAQTEALARADRSKDQFLAMLAHELRNPLAAISNAIAVLDQAGSHEERAVHLRQIIRRQAERLSDMTEDLLDLSRVTSGKIPLRKERVDLCAVLRDALETMRPALEARRHAVAVDCLGGPVWVVGDANRLEQVFTNLLHNAAKYTPERGSVSLTARLEGDDAVVTVADDGIGIEPEVLPEVFGLFTQADDSLDRTQGGLGIGLALVWHIVKLHGGQVSAHSEGLGRGSQFVVRLPVTSAEGERVPAAAPSSAPQSVSRRVLVVEDNQDAAETLTELLEMWGHRARLALDGPSGIEAALELRPEIVLLDIGLPGMDGFEVARRLREVLGSPAPRIIMLSGYGREKDHEKAREVGAERSLVKPVNPEELRQLLAEPGA